MVAEVGLVVELLAALVALERHFARVNPPVPLQQRTVPKHPIAKLALVPSLLHGLVLRHVVPELGLRAEEHPAVVAREPVAAVRLVDVLHVRFVRDLRGLPLPAVVTAIRELMRHQVLVQTDQSSEHRRELFAVALEARVRQLTHVLLQMGFQGFRVRVNRAAVVAGVGDEVGFGDESDDFSLLLWFGS